MSEQTELETQSLANRLNLGPHQHCITVEDDQGNTGRFIVRRPNMRDEIRIGVEYSRLKMAEDGAEPVHIDELRDNLAFMVATLNLVIDGRPVWFPEDAGDYFDGQVISELFDKYCTWKDSFRREVSPPQTADR